MFCCVKIISITLLKTSIFTRINFFESKCIRINVFKKAFRNFTKTRYVYDVKKSLNWFDKRFVNVFFMFFFAFAFVIVLCTRQNRNQKFDNFIEMLNEFSIKIAKLYELLNFINENRCKSLTYNFDFFLIAFVRLLTKLWILKNWFECRIIRISRKR